MDKIGGESTSLAQNRFLVWSYVIENARSYFKKEKKQADSKTAILISGKKIGLTLFN